MRGRRNQVVYTRLAADLDTPVSLMLKLTGAGKTAFMLESVTGGEVRGRYSIIGMNPDLIWECHGTHQPPQPHRPLRRRRLRADEPGEPLTTLRALLAESRDRPARRPARRLGRAVRLSRL